MASITNEHFKSLLFVRFSSFPKMVCLEHHSKRLTFVDPWQETNDSNFWMQIGDLRQRLNWTVDLLQFRGLRGSTALNLFVTESGFLLISAGMLRATSWNAVLALVKSFQLPTSRLSWFSFLVRFSFASHAFPWLASTLLLSHSLIRVLARIPLLHDWMNQSWCC